LSRLIIESEGVKREIPLPCAICITLETAHAIRDAMNQFIGNEGATYGWVTIHREKVDQKSDSKPLTWREGVQR
jgi:hypothetical protein